jgi:HD-GYP domain-containing protein (c-di-GMP phosphodiesterase class II)
MSDDADNIFDDLDNLDKVDDHYAEHLAQLDESKDVLSSKDIVNKQGVLLCKKGMHINGKTAERLIQHKLSQPLEESIMLSDSIDYAMLFNKLHQQLDTYSDCRTIHDKMAFDIMTKKTFLFTRLNPVIIQKLTVINEQMPEQLDKAVFCAWLSLLIAVEMGLDKDTRQQVYLAGLLHDIGFIHLSPEILNKKGALTPAEWRAIQSHVVIGKLMLENYKDIPAAVSKAVLEHHERCDGSGYPANKNDTTLGLIGQIVGVVDSIHAIRTKQFERHGRNMVDLLPYLQMNAKTYFYDVYKALDSILKYSGLKMTMPPKSDIALMADKSYIRSQALSHAISALHDSNILEMADELTSNKDRSLYKISTHVLTMSNESGLVGGGMHEWLKQLASDPDPEAIAELNEIELMLNELFWQLKNACRSCDESLEKSAASAETQFKLRQAYNTVGLCLGELEDKK